VSRFAAEHPEDVRFHKWLQFIADTQLKQAQVRAKQAGMRIGLYLDFAVGVAPDGFDTWSDPELTMREARVGSPPDIFNSEGQDWGLAPLAPQVLAARNFKPLADAYLAVMKNAGAIRIDHVMGLQRLWWTPASGKPANGGYVRYPFGAMLDTVAAAAAETGAIVIGEDLGTVPEGFSEAAQEAGVFSYRVLYFEKDEDGAFRRPDDYPRLALSSISTHDLATLAGWWQGSDIKLRMETGRQTEEDVEGAMRERDADRRALLRALKQAALLPSEYERLISAEAPLPQQLDEELFRSIHRFSARAASLLFAVQLDDLLMSQRQANLPGTTDEYPNWRIRVPCSLEDLGENTFLKVLADDLGSERPRAE
jgi:4-alpha-glucanotransferase